MGHSRISSAILAIISCLLWSAAFVGVKIGLEYATPLQFAGTRFFIAGLLVFPVACRFNPAYFTIVRSNLKLILLSSIAISIWIIIPAEKPQVLTVADMFIITFALVISGLLKRKKA